MEEFFPRGRASVALRFLEPRSSDCILDVGCGQGYFERYFLIGKIHKVRAIDVNPEAIDYAKKRDGDAYYLCGDASHLPFQDREFDKAVCLDTLEHVRDESKTLSEIRRVLRRDGLLVLSVPNDFLNFMDISNILPMLQRRFPRIYKAYRNMRGGSRARVARLELHRHYNLSQLRHLLTGFEIENVHKTALLSWFVVLFLTVLPTEKLRYYARKLTGPIEDLDYRFNYGCGFSLIVSARKKCDTHFSPGD
jgi:ubiquinone/menaquinone biosynthesis C-methylase UbiE